MDTYSKIINLMFFILANKVSQLLNSFESKDVEMEDINEAIFKKASYKPKQVNILYLILVRTYSRNQK